MRRGSYAHYNEFVATIFSILIVMQTILVVGGAVAALGEIERIIWIGPILSVTGLVIALVAWLRGQRWGVAFGMGVPMLSVLFLFLINALEWSPDEAYFPVNAMIAVFVLLNAPLSRLAVHEAVAGTPLIPAKLQFSIGAIMWLTACIAITLGLQRAWGWYGISVALLLWQGLIVYWSFQDFRNRDERGAKSTKSLDQHDSIHHSPA